MHAYLAEVGNPRLNCVRGMWLALLVLCATTAPGHNWFLRCAQAVRLSLESVLLPTCQGTSCSACHVPVLVCLAC